MNGLDEITELVETCSYEEADQYLKLGWMLLGTASMATDYRKGRSPVIKYSLGWKADLREMLGGCVKKAPHPEIHENNLE